MSATSGFHLYLQESKNLKPEQIEKLSLEDVKLYLDEYLDEYLFEDSRKENNMDNKLIIKFDEDCENDAAYNELYIRRIIELVKEVIAHRGYYSLYEFRAYFTKPDVLDYMYVLTEPVKFEEFHKADDGDFIEFTVTGGGLTYIPDMKK